MSFDYLYINGPMEAVGQQWGYTHWLGNVNGLLAHDLLQVLSDPEEWGDPDVHQKLLRPLHYCNVREK